MCDGRICSLKNETGCIHVVYTMYLFMEKCVPLVYQMYTFRILKTNATMSLSTIRMIVICGNFHQ